MSTAVFKPSGMQILKKTLSTTQASKNKHKKYGSIDAGHEYEETSKFHVFYCMQIAEMLWQQFL